MSDDYGAVTARYYDATYAALRDPSGDAAWYRGLAEASGGPVLELGCGTGRVLLPIARAGIECVGLDPSPAMLDALRAKSPPANLELAIGRMQDFELPGRRFALIFAAFRVFQHLCGIDDQLACLAAVRRHLAPGGAFAFDVFVPQLARTAIVSEPEAEDVRFEHDGETIVRYASVERNPAEQTLDVRMRYERRRGDVVLGDETVGFRMRWFFRYELEHLLRRAGFDDLTLYGDFDQTPFNRDATSFAIVARASEAG